MYGRVAGSLQRGVHLAEAVEELPVAPLDAPLQSPAHRRQTGLGPPAGVGVAGALGVHGQEGGGAGVGVQDAALVGVSQLIDITAPAVPPGPLGNLDVAVGGRRVGHPEVHGPPGGLQETLVAGGVVGVEQEHAGDVRVVHVVVLGRQVVELDALVPAAMGVLGVEEGERLLDAGVAVVLLAGEPPQREVLVAPGEAPARQHVQAEWARDQLVVRPLHRPLGDGRAEPAVLGLPDPLLGEFALGHVAHLVAVVVAHLVTERGTEVLAVGRPATQEHGGLEALARRHLDGERRGDGECATVRIRGQDAVGQRAVPVGAHVVPRGQPWILLDRHSDHRRASQQHPEASARSTAAPVPSASATRGNSTRSTRTGDSAVRRT